MQKFFLISRTYSIDIGLLLIRTMTGAVFAFHGAQKLFGMFSGPGVRGFAGYLNQLHIPYPELNAYLASGTELLGGLALLTGLAVRLAAVPLFFTMLVASIAAHGSAFDSLKGGMEYPLTLAVISLSLALTGGGRLAITKLLRREPIDEPQTIMSDRVSV